MASFNAMGHLLIVTMNDDINQLWDFCNELAARHEVDPDAGATIHALPATHPQRYCVHPTSSEEQSFKGDDMHQTLLRATAWLAMQLPEHELWSRG